MKKMTVPVFFYALGAMLFWGMSFIWTSILLHYYQPVTIIFIRLIISSPFLFSVIFITRSLTKVHKKDIPLLILSSVFNPFLYFLLENYGLMNTSPAIAAVIIATIPVFSPIIARFSFGEKLRWFNIAGILVSFAGIVIMLVNPSFSFTASPAGVLFLAGAVVAALFYSVTLKKLTLRYTSLTIISWQNLAGIFLFLPFFLIFEAREAVHVPLNLSIVSSFLFLAILASSLSYVFYVRTVQHLGISKANIFSNLIPVFTALFSFFLLNESFTMQKIIGIGVVVSGVILSEINKPKA